MRINAFATLLCVGLAVTGLTVAGGSQGPPASNAALHALYDREWEWELTQDPFLAFISAIAAGTTAGPSPPESFAERHAHRQGLLKEINAISRETPCRPPTGSTTSSSGTRTSD